MPNHRLRLLIIPALALAALMYVLPRATDRDTASAEADRRGSAANRILVEKTFANYEECDETAQAAALELKEKGLKTALTARNKTVQTTLYKVYYPDGSTDQIICRGEQLVHEALD
mgnify:FL=1